ncbi:MAG: heavy-metal-associated domain-containing protein [Candidatus Magasanikbacteria bacterium]
MKNFLIPFMIILVGGGIIGGFFLFNNPDSSNINNAGNLKQAQLSIKNMYCIGCKRSIESAIGSVAGVKDIKVSLADDSGKVIYNPNKITAKKIVSQSIFKTYPAQVKSIKPYSGDKRQDTSDSNKRKRRVQVPNNIKQKLNQLAKLQQGNNKKLSPQLKSQINNSIRNQNWSKAGQYLTNAINSLK